MFRKIHSKPYKVGLLPALGQAFGSRIGPLFSGFRKLCLEHPKKIFSLMVLLMAGSMVLCFSVMRTEAPPLKKTATVPAGLVGSAPSGVGNTIDKLQRVMVLQAELGAMTKKETLSPADSLRFLSMLTEIRALTSNQK